MPLELESIFCLRRWLVDARVGMAIDDDVIYKALTWTESESNTLPYVLVFTSNQACESISIKARNVITGDKQIRLFYWRNRQVSEGIYYTTDSWRKRRETNWK